MSPSSPRSSAITSGGAAGTNAATAAATDTSPADDPILCQHCGRTASNGISCEGACVADSGY